MTEYITKQQAINVVNTAFGHIYDTDSETVSLVDLQNEIVMTIEQHTETADVVEVVRCKDCAGKKACDVWGIYLDDDDFCSHGR